MLSNKEILVSEYEIGSTNSYNTSSILIGSLLKTYVDTSGSTYIQPLEIQYEPTYDYLGTGLSFRPINAIKATKDTDYLVSWDGTSVNGYRRIMAYKYQKSVNKFTPLGSILIYPRHSVPIQATTIGRVTGFVYHYDSGSVTVSGSSFSTSSLVSGSNTNWDRDRINQGARVGFGTTDPDSVIDWYEINDVPTRDRFNINGVLNYTSSVPYVIQELKLAVSIRHATTAGLNGVEMIHGLSENAFSLPGNFITNQYSSSLQDRQRGHYKITENHFGSFAFVNVNGMSFVPEVVSPTEHYLYASNYNSTIYFQLAKINALFPAISCSFSSSASGSVEGPVVFTTGRSTIGAVTGVTSNYESVIAKTSHGPGSGSYSLYYDLPTLGGTSDFRFTLYRTNIEDSSTMYSGSINFISDSCIEVPPGGDQVRYVVGSVQLLYVSSIDKFVTRMFNVARDYQKFGLLRYDNNLNPNNLRHFFFASRINKAFDTIDSDLPNYYINGGDVIPEVATSDEMLYVAIGSSFTAAGRQRLCNIPIGADYESAPKTKQWVTFPPISTPNAIKYKNIYVRSPKFIGTDFLGYTPEKLVIFYRTSGISDDSGKWIRLFDNGDLSSISISSQIQFSIAFDVLGLTGLFNRVYGICLTYEDAKQDYHYYPSSEKSDMQNNIVAWKQVRSWDYNIPNLKISLYNSSSNYLLLEDTTNLQENGVFEYSSNNGNTWNAWNNSVSSVGNFIRYRANSLPGNVTVKAYISLA